MADGLNRTNGEKNRDESIIKLLQGIFKSLEKIAVELTVMNESNSTSSKKK